MAYEAKFKAAAAIIQKLPKSGPVQPTDEDKLIVTFIISLSFAFLAERVITQFYRYYKQVNVGDCNVPPPSAFQFTEKAKWFVQPR
jgi:diazepam-binding inhibitor (GABA receptor modulating acyl-CoA-binding protein)